MLKPVELEGFVLQQEDLLELWPDADQTDMENVAIVVADYLMGEWASCLRDAINLVKGEKERAAR